MTGDGIAIGSKFGIAFTGKWVWKMKDYIDVSFMNLFERDYLFWNFETKGYSDPYEQNELYEEEKKELAAKNEAIKENVALMSA